MIASAATHIPSSSFCFLFFFFFFFFLFFSALWQKKKKRASTTIQGPSSSSESSSSSNSNSSYDVFLSFRGGDTRYTFADRLYHALKDKGINTFRDDEGLNKGDKIAPALLKVIEASKFSVVVFSENYADSKWCLEELAKIMECKKERNQTVIPIFYHVDPSEQVRKQRGIYGEAFAVHERDADEEKRKKIQKWRTALSEAGNLAGHHILKNQYESTFIKKIIDQIIEDLKLKLMFLEEFIVGIDPHMRELKSLLETHRMVGIYGIGGIGKTTIAKIIYNDMLSKFDGGSFLQNVREEFQKGCQHKLQKQLLRDIVGKDIKLTSMNDGMNMIKGRLNSKKLLIVFDDVDDSNKLKSLVGSLDWFSLESRFIITTRDQQVISKCRMNASSYKINELNYHDSLQLFCRHAFEQNDLEENYRDLSKHIVYYAQGLPLALTILGSFLRDQEIDEWESAFDELKKNPDRDPNKTINNVLKISFEGLDDKVKDAFLDIACFYKGENKDFVSRMLDDDKLSGKTKISELFYKCLITISGKNTIDMHDLVQQMGWAIVREENSSPYKGTRLWDPNDIDNAFSNKEGIENIEVISFDLSRIEKVNKKVFIKMKKLRLLKVYWSGRCDTLILPKDFNFPSQKLKYLYWEVYPLKTLPSNFQGENLVELDMKYSNIERLWSKSKTLGKLKVINLGYSKKLTKMSKFCTMPNLERLNLEGCTSLRKLDKSIRELKKLTLLDLGGCTQLNNLPSSIDDLQSLEFLVLKGCQKLEKLPEIRENIGCLRELDLGGSGIKELPSSFKYLTSLQHLNLSDCSNFEKLPEIFGNMRRLRKFHLDNSGIKELPRSIGGLESLELLSLSDCSNFEIFPEINGNMKSLTWLRLEYTAIKELPKSIDCLESLEELDLIGCINLETFPETFGNMRHLRELLLEKSGIRELPRSIGGLESLEILSLSGCSNFERFPEIQGNMESLRWLRLDNTAIKELPRSIFCLESLEELDLRGCINLEKFPDIQRNMGNLRSLHLEGTAIRELPSAIDHLIGLYSLDLRNLKNLRSLPSSIYRMKSLRNIRLDGCSSLECIPEIMEEIECSCLPLDETTENELPSPIEYGGGVELLEVRNCENLVNLPDSIGNLTCLERLTVVNSSKLQKLPDNLRSLQCYLEELDVSGCRLVEGAIPSDLWSLHSLSYLNISQNDIRSIPVGISQLSKLSRFYMNDCKLLEEITQLPSSLRRIQARGCPGPCLETLLSNQASKLLSLEELDISQSDIRRIPAAIIQLSKLEYLYMNDCKLVQEITELPSSLGTIEARGCPCFETSVSNPSSQLWSSQIRYFKSYNERVESCSNGREDSYWDMLIEIVVPGNNGIPEWVSHKNVGGEVTIDLPPNWYNDNTLLGFALFFHVPFDNHHAFGGAKCVFSIFRGDESEEIGATRISCDRSEPQLWVKYFPRFLISRKHQSNRGGKFKVSLYFYPTKNNGEHPVERKYEEAFSRRFKRNICGIHLVYAQD